MDFCNITENSYVLPASQALEMVILTDENMNYGIIDTNGITSSLSSEAVKVLNDAFFVNYPSKISDLNPDGNSNLTNLLSGLSENRVISLGSNPPTVDSSVEYTVNPGDVINQNSVVTSEPIIAEYAGRVICVKIGPVAIYIYFSVECLLDIVCGSNRVEGYDAIVDFGPLGVTILPVPNKMALGANCSVCGACGGCGACGACALCGGLNFGAAAIALVAVDAALAVTGALSAFATNRG